MSATSRSHTSVTNGSGRIATRWQESADGIRLVLGMLAVMWVAWIVDAIDNYKLNPTLGIRPHNVDHLYGILTAPFLHQSFGHIFGNTIPFLILGVIIAGSGYRRVLQVTAISILVSGLGVWLIASTHGYTVGASGVVFGFAAYLVARGFVDRKVAEIAIGAIVGAVFGLSLLWDLVPKSGVSWQGHLFGLLGGVLAALLLSDRRRASASATP